MIAAKRRQQPGRKRYWIGFEDVAVAGVFQRDVGVLLGEQERHALPCCSGRRTISKISSTIWGARPIDGSSSRIIEGWAISARARRRHLLLAARRIARGTAALFEPREAR